jgi:CheY-like chemotaxis protein
VSRRANPLFAEILFAGPRIEAGMNDFLVKPFDPDMLFATLLRSLSRREV